MIKIIIALLALDLGISIYNNLKLRKMGHTLDETLALVSEQSTVDDSIITLLNGISLQLKDALSGTTLPTDVQAKIDSVFDSIAANKQKVADAVTANTPAT